MKYYEIYVNDKICNAYSIFVEGTEEEFKNEKDVINSCIKDKIFNEDGDEKYIEYIEEIDKDTYESAMYLSKNLNNFPH